MTGLKRSHMCGDINESLAGSKVTVMGWVQRRRDLGQLIFIALRDRTGIVQAVVDGNSESGVKVFSGIDAVATFGNAVAKSLSEIK